MNYPSSRALHLSLCVSLFGFLVLVIACTATSTVRQPTPVLDSPDIGYSYYQTAVQEERDKTVSADLTQWAVEDMAATSIAENMNPAPRSRCIDWTEAAYHIGETTCVQGNVSWAGVNGGTYFIDYGNTYTDFYGVSFDYTFQIKAGDCVAINGLIQTYKGRPEIIIRNPNQVQYCQ